MFQYVFCLTPASEPQARLLDTQDFMQLPNIEFTSQSMASYIFMYILDVFVSICFLCEHVSCGQSCSLPRLHMQPVSTRDRFLCSLY